MAIFFSTAPGKVIRIDSQGLLLPFQIAMTNWGGFGTQQAIITQGGVQLDGAFQFLHTLNDFIYVYTFGDRIGELMVSGVTFLDNCAGQAVSGFESVLGYYYANRIANLGGPVKVSFGSTALGVFQGFLTGMKVDIVDSESLLGQFAYRLNVFPVAAPVASGVGGSGNSLAGASSNTPASATSAGGNTNVPIFSSTTPAINLTVGQTSSNAVTALPEPAAPAGV